MRIAREMRHEPDPGRGDVQQGRTRGETARQAGGMGHELLPLMAAREGIGHMLFHQTPPCENPPLSTPPANELSTPNSVAEAFVDEYSDLWIHAMKRNLTDQRARGLSETHSNQRA